MAVVVRNVTFSYDRKTSKKTTVQALNQVNLTASYGSIYGLLGPSGCGKTTLLSSCLGVSQPKFGTILVLGGRPGDPKVGVPGPLVGYMPQTESLHSYFNPRELLRYYSRIFKVQDSEKRIEEILQNLDLNEKESKQRIDSLSGGQRRRVSLAASLVHKPKLLFL